jgi:hypothetical protein
VVVTWRGAGIGVVVAWNDDGSKSNFVQSSFEFRHHMTRCSNSTQEIFTTYSRLPSSSEPFRLFILVFQFPDAT